jgi:hypothetical protein
LYAFDAITGSDLDSLGINQQSLGDIMRQTLTGNQSDLIGRLESFTRAVNQVTDEQVAARDASSRAMSTCIIIVLTGAGVSYVFALRRGNAIIVELHEGYGSLLKLYIDKQDKSNFDSIVGADTNFQHIQPLWDALSARIEEIDKVKDQPVIGVLNATRLVLIPLPQFRTNALNAIAELRSKLN